LFSPRKDKNGKYVNSNEEFSNNQNECDYTLNKIIPQQNNKNNFLNLIRENAFYNTNKQKIILRNEVKSFLIKISDLLSKHSIVKDFKELKLEKMNSNVSANKSIVSNSNTVNTGGIELKQKDSFGSG